MESPVVSFEHKRLLELLAAAEEAPADAGDLSGWLRGERHLQFLLTDIHEKELTLAVLSRSQTCVNSYVVPANLPELQEGPLKLMKWPANPLHHDASNYAWGWGTDGVHAIRQDDEQWRAPHDLPIGVSPLVFFRSVEGDASLSREVAQDFVHAAGIHRRRERSALSRIDYRGDWEDVVSQSTRDTSATADLFSVRREVLDLHLVALDAVLVRVFDLTLRSPSLPRNALNKSVF